MFDEYGDDYGYDPWLDYDYLGEDPFLEGGGGGVYEPWLDYDLQGSVDDAFFDLWGIEPGEDYLGGYQETDLGIAVTSDPLAGVEPITDWFTNLLQPTDYWGTGGAPVETGDYLSGLEAMNTGLDALLSPISFTPAERQAMIESQTAGQSWLSKLGDWATNALKGLSVGAMPGGSGGAGVLPSQPAKGLLGTNLSAGNLLLLAGGAGAIYLIAKKK